MSRYSKKIISVLAMMLTLLAVLTVTAAGASAENLYVSGNYSLNYTRIKNSSLAASDNGYVRVINLDDGIIAEEYDDNLKLLAKHTITKELDIYGGFFSGSDAYYFIFGQNNEEQNTDKEVIRVVKYSKSWQRISAASLKGDSEFAHEVRYPFDYGNVSCAESNGYLYIVTGHEGYVDASVGQGHQGYLMFMIKESDMSWKLADADLWHSFSQHITIMDDDHIYVAEESEGSECTKVTQYTASSLSSDERDYFYNDPTVSVLSYGGMRTSAWAVATYATVDAISYSSSNVLVLGTSIVQDRYSDSSYTKSYNIYLTVTPINNFTSEASKLVWLTDCDAEDGFKDVKLTKINDNRFLVSWESYTEEESIGSSTEMDSLNSHVLHYVFIDGNGAKLSKEFTAAAAISDCEPVLKNGKVIYYASDNSVVAFYTIDASTGEFSKKLYNTCGVNGKWEYANGTLVITGSGAVNGNTEWWGGTSPFIEFSDKITKIVINDGITAIGDYAFCGLDKVTTVEIGKDVKSIGVCAFSDCESLGDVYLPSGLVSIGEKAFYGRRPYTSCTFIPKTVTSIGEDAFSSGWFYTTTSGISYINYTTIYCESGSAAEKYAKSNGIEYVTAAVTLKNKTVNATGKAISIKKATTVGTEGKVSYKYYTNKKCTTLTTTANGAKSKGAAPSNPGTYYVRATAAAYKSFGEVKSNIATLTIKSTSSHPFTTDSVKKSDLAVNQVVKDTASNGKYKITSVTKKSGAVSGGTVTYLAPCTKKVGSISIKNTVSICGIKFKVTAVANKALYKNTTITSLTIGKNVTSIGKYAFYGCTKLKTITIKSASLTSKSLGTKSFSGIYSKAVVKVPKAKYSAYKSLLTKAGFAKKTQKVVKY